MSNNYSDISFSDLRCKEVVNASDGRRLGRIVDLIFSGETGKIKGIVVPAAKRNVFSKAQELFIPWRCVDKLGEDVIIVSVGADGNCDEECEKPRPKSPKPPCPPPPKPSCDGRCEKCMLFDCERRWKSGN